MYCFAPGAGCFLRADPFQERALHRDLVDRVIFEEVIEADLAGVGDLLRGKRHLNLHE
jgi:hypothetical protein